MRQPAWLVAQGQVKTGLKVDQPWKDRSLTGIGPKLGGYPEKELETIPSLELQTIANATNQPVNRTLGAGRLAGSQVQRLADRGFRLQPHRLHRRQGPLPQPTRACS